MTDLYLVWIWDGYNDSCADLQIIFTIEKEAIDYASVAYLPHKGVVYVAKEQIGVCSSSRDYKPNCVYRREHYDPQEELWNEARWFYLKGMDKEQFIRLVIGEYSPMCVDVDWDQLYQKCVDFYD